MSVKETRNIQRGAFPLRLLRQLLKPEQRGKWLYWERGLTVFGTVGTAVALLGLAWQVYLTNQQIEVMWYQMRPSLYIEPIAHKDATLGRLVHPTVPDSLSNLGVYSISFTTTNIGNSTAVLDSQFVDVVYRNMWFRTRSSKGGDIRTMGKPVADFIETIMAAGERSYFDIRLTYTWDVAERRNEKFEYRKPYQVDWGGSGWSFHTISPGKFDSVIATFADAKDVRISDTGIVTVKPVTERLE